jgi:shikimate kinase
VAKLLAQRLGLQHVDLDRLIEERAGMAVADLFTRDGEAAFRQLESETLRSLVDSEPMVVACGGGVVLDSANRAVLKQSGTVVYLEVTAAEAVARVGDSASRPLLAGPAGAMAATSLLAAREALYHATADIVVETVGRSPSHVTETIVGELETGPS